MMHSEGGHTTNSLVNGPVRSMWGCGTPDPAKPGAGFAILEQAEHALVFAGDREDGAYNHHSQLTRHNGTFHAIWSNHPYGEDGPGQRVLYATSLDAETWSDALELFPPLGPVLSSEENGLALTAFRWVPLDDRLFAVVGCHANIGFCDFERTRFAPRRDVAHPARARRGYTSIAREVHADGSVGPVFALGKDLPEDTAYAVLPYDVPYVAQEAAQLSSRLATPLGMPAWDFQDTLGFPKTVEGHRLCEPTVYEAVDGKFVMLLRDTRYSHRMYVTISPDGRRWEPAVPTDIPDSPSLTTSVKLDDGRVLLVGNQMAPAFDNPDQVTHYERDPLMFSVSSDGYRFERAFALRCGRQIWRVPQREVRGRGGGAQYPSVVVHQDTLYVQYTMGKEDVWVSSVALSALAGENR